MSDDTVKLRKIELPKSRIFPEVYAKETGELDLVVPSLEHKSTVPNFGLLPIVDSMQLNIIFEPDVPKTLYEYLMVNCGMGMKRPVMGQPAYRSFLALADQILSQLVSQNVLRWEWHDDEETRGAWVFEGVI